MLVGLAAYLRLANVDQTPGWYTDEGTHLDIARHILQGETRYLAITQSTILFAKFPLFEWLLAGSIQLVGVNILALRGLTGLLGVISVILVYGVIRHKGDRLLALLAAGLLAIYPQAVLYSRFGFSYNLLAPLAIVSLWGLWCYEEDPRPEPLILSSLAIGLGLLSDLAMASFLVILILIVAYKQWQHLWWSVLLAILPLGLFAGWQWLTVPEAFVFDWAFTFSRLGGRSPAGQLHLLLDNSTTLLSQDSWLALGLVGLFFLRGRLKTLALLFFLVPIALQGRTVALHSLSFYYMIPVLPFITIGLAALLRYGIPALLEGINAFLAPSPYPYWSQPIAKVITIALVALPFVYTAYLTSGRVNNTYHTIIDPFLINPQDAQAVADWLNPRLQADDVVIASPAQAWLLDGQVADFQMMMAYPGRETPHLPSNIPHNRFAFNPSPENATYVIIDPLWHNWAIHHIPDLTEFVQTTTSDTPIYETPTIQVYFLD